MLNLHDPLMFALSKRLQTAYIINPKKNKYIKGRGTGILGDTRGGSRCQGRVRIPYQTVSPVVNSLT